MGHLAFMFEGIDFKNASILDAATGAGGNTLNVAREVAQAGGTGHVVSVDIDSRTFDYARKKLGDLAQLVQFVQADMADLPFPEASFDVVISTATLCAVNSKPLRAVKALQELYRVLKPGGWCVIKEEYPFYEPPASHYRVQHQRWQLYKGICELASLPHFHEIEPHDLINTLKLIGFTVVQWNRFEGFRLNDITMKEYYKDVNALIEQLDARQLRIALATEVKRIECLFARSGGEFPPQYVIRCKKQLP